MSGLVLKLGPKERVLINGAIVENGDRRSKISIKTPNANILRLRDAIQPEDAKTPVRQACFAVQLVLSGDSDPEDARCANLRQIEQLIEMFGDTKSREYLKKASESLQRDQHYKCLKMLKLLIPLEDKILGTATH